MHLSKEIDNIIGKVNDYKKTKDECVILIKEICNLFDLALDREVINNNELSILYFLSNFIGIPQYYDLLCKLKDIPDYLPIYNNIIFSSLVRESSLYIDTEIKLHIFQKNLLERFTFSSINRFLISASTSFGKTFIVNSIIKKMDYENIVLIYPTVSLLSENLERFIKLSKNNFFNKYNIITLSEEDVKEKNNIMIFTPERFMTFIDKNPNLRFDFVFIDEIYKIDNDFINSNYEEDEKRNDDRDIAFRIALEMSIRKTKDMLLTGPFLNLENSNSISNFINDNKFELINYNDYELVNRNQTSYIYLKSNDFDGIKFENIKCKNNNTDKIYTILSKLSNEQSIVYCSSRYLAEDYALKISQKKIYNIDDHNDRFKNLLIHLKKEFGDNWCLVKCLENGIGIHHGTIPKYIQREIINMFNNGVIKCIFCTTTITEGVNTTAKNMIVLSHKKGNKDLKKFDILNIIGRAGRFNQHFSGRIFLIDNQLEDILESNGDILTHKNYIEDTSKSDIDLEITLEKYLSEKDIQNKNNIKFNYSKNNVPDNIRNSFLMISPKEKIKMYKLISKFTNINGEAIPNLIKIINKNSLTLPLIDLLVRIIRSVIPKDDIIYAYTQKGKYEHSILSYLLNSYLKGGYKSLLAYKLKKGVNMDLAIRETSKIVYTIFRYELVKHISIIDLIYRTIYSEILNIPIKDVNGFSPLLSYLEYGAYSEKGRKASDFGVPFKVLKYIENKKIDLDKYENMVYEEVEKIIN